jgi:release factor glutamine methyltransferase
MKSLGEVLRLSTHFLSERKIESPRRLVEELLAHSLKCKRIDLYLQFDRPMEEKELEELRVGVKRVSRHEPIEYILGEIDFFGSSIQVDSRALIPRQETELLVDLIAKKITSQKTLWDVCTGSGCIGISLKKKLPHLEVSLSDISPEALALAKKNGERNSVDVKFFLGDLLEPFKGETTDLFICNPPYVSSQEFLTLDPSVRDFEPKLALVGGEEGLDFYKRLSHDLPKHINPGGWVFLEIGLGQRMWVEEIFCSPVWGGREWISDLSGKDRFFFLEKQSLSSVS